MTKIILIIFLISVVCLLVGVFLGYRLNPIKAEQVEDLDAITRNLDEVIKVADTDVDLLRTHAFASILVEVSERLKKGDDSSAISIIESSLADIKSELTADLDLDELNSDELELLKLIEGSLGNDKNNDANK